MHYLFRVHKGGRRFFPSIIRKAILSRGSFHDHQLRVLKSMQFAGACVTHAHPPEENFLLELTVNAAHTVRANEWIPAIARRLRDLFVECLRYARGEGQIVPVRKCRIKSAIKARMNE